MKTRIKLLALIIGVLTLFLGGCVRPYNKPQFVTIEPNQTAFVIPLKGKTSEQGRFESEEFLRKAQVATKRIKIEKEWVQTGRLWFQGKWMPTMKVIVVDRYPETREWGKNDDNGFIGESKDSIKFKVGISATAQILEEDTARFLYQYAGKSLKQVMDSEIRNKIGTTLLEKYGTMSIEEIRTSKKEVIEYVRSVVEPYFKERGITLSNIGYVGDLQYLQKDIQESINKRFKAEQEQKAQQIENKTLIEKAQAEAKAAQIRQQALQAQIEIKKLENQKAWIEKWDGKLPTYMGNGKEMITIPAPDASQNR